MVEDDAHFLRVKPTGCVDVERAGHAFPLMVTAGIGITLKRLDQFAGHPFAHQLMHVGNGPGTKSTSAFAVTEHQLASIQRCSTSKMRLALLSLIRWRSA